MPFQHLPEGTEKEHKNLSRLPVSGKIYELGDPFRNYDPRMLLTAALYLDGAERIKLTTHLKETRFHHMVKNEMNPNIIVTKHALLYPLNFLI
jgi:hypothetical protein